MGQETVGRELGGNWGKGNWEKELERCGLGTGTCGEGTGDRGLGTSVFCIKIQGSKEFGDCPPCRIFFVDNTNLQAENWGEWAGNWGQQTGDRELRTRNWRQGTETGNWRQGTGAANWKQGTWDRNWRQGTGGSKIGDRGKWGFWGCLRGFKGHKAGLKSKLKGWLKGGFAEGRRSWGLRGPSRRLEVFGRRGGSRVSLRGGLGVAQGAKGGPSRQVSGGLKGGFAEGRRSCGLGGIERG